MTRVGISLGSNLGDRLAHLREAVARLTSAPTPVRLLAASPVYETEPVDCAPGDPAFLNAVIEVETDLPPLPLLDLTQGIERDLGRAATREPNAPRPIDLDLLYYGELKLDSERLVLPHPRMHQRDFVRIPLAQIRPDRLPNESTRPASDPLPSGIRGYGAPLLPRS